MNIYKKSSTSSKSIYECKSCDYITSRKNNFEKHLLSKKHILSKNHSNKVTNENPNICICGKSFKHISSLSRHRQTCKRTSLIEPSVIEPSVIEPSVIEPSFIDPSVIEPSMIEPSLVMELVKTNIEFRKMCMAQSQQISSILDDVSNGRLANNSHNTNNINNRFNINIFLNEHCKDAMNIEDFVDSIDFTLDDLEETGKHGYIKGLTRIITNKLKSMDLFTRPLHCTDVKRETLYIKEENNWKKDDEQHTMLRNVIADVAAKNEGMIEEWKESNPLCKIAGTKETDQMMDIYYNTITGTNEEAEKFNKKIIKNVLKDVMITKV